MATYLQRALLLLVCLAVGGCAGPTTLPQVNGWFTPTLAESEVDALRQLVADGDLTAKGLQICPVDDAEDECRERPHALVGEGHVRELSLSGQAVASVDPISSLTKLEALDFSSNDLTSVKLGSLPELRELDLSANDLQSLTLHDLNRLETLNLEGNGRLQTLTLSKIGRLEELTLERPQLTELAAEELPRLERLVVTKSALQQLELDDLPRLTALSVQGDLQQVDLPFEELTKLQKLNLTGNRLAEFTLPEIPSLEILQLNDNELTRLDLDTDESGELEGVGSLSNSYNILLAPTVDLKFDGNQLPEPVVGKLTDLRDEYEEEADELRIRPTRVRRGTPGSDLPSVGEGVVGGGGGTGRGRSPRRRHGGGFRGGK